MGGMDAIDLLTTRASNGKLGEPAPDEPTLRNAFAAAVRAPDHALLRPWRFRVVRGEARVRLGEVFRESERRRHPEASADMLDRAGAKPLRAPLIIVVAATPRENPKVPRVEQVVSAGMAAHAILLALHAQGFAAICRTGPPAYDPHVKRALGLGEDDEIVAFLYAGTPSAPYPPIERPSHEAFVDEWTGPLG